MTGSKCKDCVKKVRYYKTRKYLPTTKFSFLSGAFLDKYKGQPKVMRKVNPITNVSCPKKLGAFKIKDYNFMKWLFNEWR